MIATAPMRCLDTCPGGGGRHEVWGLWIGDRWGRSSFTTAKLAMGVPEVSSKTTSAELRPLRPGRKAPAGDIQSTNCGVRSRHGADCRQSRAGSLLEAVANVMAGFLIALLGQQLILPLFGIEVGLAAHAGIAALFTLLSLMRSFVLRRLFDHMDHVRRQEEQARRERLRQAFGRGGF